VSLLAGQEWERAGQRQLAAAPAPLPPPPALVPFDLSLKGSCSVACVEGAAAPAPQAYAGPLPAASFPMGGASQASHTRPNGGPRGERPPGARRSCVPTGEILSKERDLIALWRKSNEARARARARVRVRVR